uniref:Putative homing endonuclease n=1 Tax=viral metagenome TaxID=1070528 RepID=A0A6H1ZFC6_9ZZZZ
MNSRRELWQEEHGEIPKGWVVHNLNGNGTDNRIENLAAVPRNPDHVGQVIAPYRERIRKLEKELKLLKEKD